MCIAVPSIKTFSYCCPCRWYYITKNSVCCFVIFIYLLFLFFVYCARVQRKEEHTVHILTILKYTAIKKHYKTVSFCLLLLQGLINLHLHYINYDYWYQEAVVVGHCRGNPSHRSQTSLPAADAARRPWSHRWQTSRLRWISEAAAVEVDRTCRHRTSAVSNATSNTVNILIRHKVDNTKNNIKHAVASLGVRRGGRTARVTPSRGWYPNEKKFLGKFTKNSGETRSDR